MVVQQALGYFFLMLFYLFIVAIVISLVLAFSDRLTPREWQKWMTRLVEKWLIHGAFALLVALFTGFWLFMY